MQWPFLSWMGTGDLDVWPDEHLIVMRGGD